jgi:hypothetical protein
VRTLEGVKLASSYSRFGVSLFSFLIYEELLQVQVFSRIQSFLEDVNTYFMPATSAMYILSYVCSEIEVIKSVAKHAS